MITFCITCVFKMQIGVCNLLYALKMKKILKVLKLIDLYIYATAQNFCFMYDILLNIYIFIVKILWNIVKQFLFWKL